VIRLLLYHVRCADANDRGTASGTTLQGGARCKLRWIEHRHTSIPGATFLLRSYATTQEQCLDACLANSSCVAVEWSGEFGCWVDDGHFRSHGYRRDATTFVPVRPCDNLPAGKQ